MIGDALELCLNDRFAKVIALSAFISVLTTPIAMTFGNLDKIGDGLMLSMFLGMPIALIAFLAILFPAALTWTAVMKLASNHIKSIRLATIFAAPLSIALGNVCFFLVAGLILKSDPLQPTFVGVVVAFGTPLALLASPFVAWHIYRADRSDA